MPVTVFLRLRDHTNNMDISQQDHIGLLIAKLDAY